MAKKQTIVPSEILAGVVANIKARLRKVDDYRVSAAILIHEARELVAEGAAGESVKWSEWAPKQFKLGYREIKRLAHIGSAAHPETAMAEYREAEANRMKELRANRKAAAIVDKRLGDVVKDMATPEKSRQSDATSVVIDTERHHRELAAAAGRAVIMENGEPEPTEFTAGDFVIADGDIRLPPAPVSVRDRKQAPPVEADEEVDGIEPISERLPEDEAERLRIWNIAVRAFVSLSHDRRRAFVQWAVGMCVDPDGEEDPLEIPTFLQRNK